MIQKKGRLADIIFHNDENGYTIAVIQTTGSDEEPVEEFTAVGTLPGAKKGNTYILCGDYKVHSRYGEQFAFREYQETMPEGEEGIVDFLAAGVLKGIGPKAAAAIVAEFGTDTLEVIEKTPEKLMRVSGIGEKKATSIAQSFREHKEFAGVTLLLQRYGIDAKNALRFYRAYGAAAVDIIQSDPYQLVDDVTGFGFRKADAIARKTGITMEDESRVSCGIQYVLGRIAGDGNTFYPKKEFAEEAAAMLEVSVEVVDDQLYALSFAGELKIEIIDGREVVYPYGLYVAEQQVTAQLMQLENASLKPIDAPMDSLISLIEKEKEIAFSQEQKEAMKAGTDHGVTVITGGPGTGKTTIINGIVGILEAGGMKTAVAAPTGRAAKRITETTGHEASTIHRLLEYYYSEGEDRMLFGRNREKPLEYDAIVIDETSMVDLLLMEGLITAIRPGCRLILVGDADQLPSVGAGNVLRDIINSEYIYAVNLETIFRQARESLIVVNAHRINKGESPYINDKDKDFFLMQRDTVPQMVETIVQLCKKRLPDHYHPLDPIGDIQVLTPVRKGELGTWKLNARLQQALNPPSPDLEEKKYGDKIFREGDKVMQIRNNYQLLWKRSGDFTEGEGVFNGDIGFIHYIDNEEGTVTVVFDEDKYVQYDVTSLDELELAYAMTVHKSQGSEFPVVIMPLSWFPPMLATRNLLYTAVTRGKKLVVMVGSPKQLQSMIANDRIKERYSGLAARLGEQL